jgi:hypothetical protein
MATTGFSCEAAGKFLLRVKVANHVAHSMHRSIRVMRPDAEA